MVNTGENIYMKYKNYAKKYELENNSKNSKYI